MTDESSESTYIADSETIIEMARLAEQDIFMTRKVSGLLPPDVNADEIQTVLDIGCGPGGWAIEMAKAYPRLQITGIDISPRMIEYAEKRALADEVPNVHFAVMDFRKIVFTDNSFDIVNARFVQWFLSDEVRTQSVRDWYRVLRPGGILRVIENEVSAMTNSEAFEILAKKFILALEQTGKTVSPGGRNTGVTLLLRPLLQSLGCQDIQEVAYLINFSAGMKERELLLSDMIRGMETMSPFMLSTKMIGKKALAKLQYQAQQDIQSPDFLGMTFFVSVWGRKPG